VDAWQAGLPVSVIIAVEKKIDSCCTRLDPTQWRSVIRHLLQNARFALASGGNLEVTLKRQELTPSEVAELRVASHQVLRLTVQDNGIGMSDTTLRRACEPFFSTRPRTRAAGLGLTFVYSMARFHGGQIVIESEEDVGTTVTIWLPAVSVVADPPAFGTNTDFIRKPAARINSGKVLVIDDDPMLLEVLKACLQRSHFEVQTASDGAEGWEIFKKQGEGLALVVCDVNMPNMDGIDMAREVRKVNARIPILLMSGEEDYAMVEGLRRLDGLPLPPLLKKPFKLADFMRMVQQPLGGIPG
jgi:CheY-like chemotaxis protein